jgi:hypothetical protein
LSAVSRSNRALPWSGAKLGSMRSHAGETSDTPWLATGKSPVQVKEALGHSDLKTTMGYYTLVPEHLDSLIDDEPHQRATGT